MTKDEALKLALEALEYRPLGATSGEKDLNDRAITAIREALALPVATRDTSQERVDETAKQRHEQEPVGVVGMDVSRPHMRSLDGQYFGQKPDTKTVMLFKDLEVGTKLYTTPQPQRTWVGLTDEEVSEVLGSDIHDEPSGELDFIRAIEAKLKEKNT